MVIRIHLICSMLLLGMLTEPSVSQDLTGEAAAAKTRLRQKQLADSRRLLDHMVERDQWISSGSTITYMFGKTFDDELVAPLIALTDGDANTPRQRLIWHAIGYTQTNAGAKFLKQRLEKGSDEEQKLAQACMAAVELRKRGVQCDLSAQGLVKSLYFQNHRQPVTRDDMELVASLPAVESLSIANPADGAMTPLRKVTTLTFVDVGCKTAYVDEAIACLTNSKNMSALNLRGPITDGAMPGIGKFAALTTLRLNGSRVTDHGLTHLKSLKKLSILELNDTAVTDEGLRHLSGLTNLTYLFLAGTRVTGAGFPHLKDMHKLWAFKLDRTQIDDRALSNFQEFEALQNVSFLYLEKTKITDAGLKHLAAMKKVEGISLSGNEQITSAGIAHLYPLGNLKWLTCPGGSVSHKAAEKFAAGRPASFYLTYTTAPGGAIRHEKGRPNATVDSPQAELLKKLRRPDRHGHVAQAVIDEVAAEGPEIVEMLLAAVKKQHGIYQDAARVLHKLGPDTLDTLVETLREDSDYRLRSTVSRTFYLHGMPIFPRLRKMLTDDNHDVRFVAADVMYDLLVRSGTQIPEGLFPELLTAATDKNAQVRQQVFSLLRMFPDRIDEMLTLLERVAGEDPDITTRTRAIAAVGYGVIKLDKSNPTYPQCVEVLCRALEKDSSFHVREATIYYLEKLAAKDKQALRALVRATGDETASTRRKAADALKKLGHPIEGK